MSCMCVSDSVLCSLKSLFISMSERVLSACETGPAVSLASGSAGSDRLLAPAPHIHGQCCVLLRLLRLAGLLGLSLPLPSASASALGLPRLPWPPARSGIGAAARFGSAARSSPSDIWDRRDNAGLCPRRSRICSSNLWKLSWASSMSFRRLRSSSLSSSHSP